ncbi:T9SS type A sorting domain-containing protein [Bacteroidota bacterium]|nr:T9SS type A sorting domain-containing protein [Bacteroidota bacterium]
MYQTYLIIGSLFIGHVSMSQTPSLFNFTPTNLSGTMYGQAQVNGVFCSSNDWIAAFDSSGICAGASQIVVNSGIAYINLVIYGDDPTTSVDEGITSNEDFYLKLFNFSNGIYIDYQSPSNVVPFGGWVNVNGSPMPNYNNVGTIYDFTSVQNNVTLNISSSLCENDPPMLLNMGTPTGGIYSGNGVNSNYFDPSITGPGYQLITYSINGASVQDSILVHQPVSSDLITSGPFCDNENGINLISEVTGGVYSGSGIINNQFFPDQVGPGTFWINYDVTDSNSCLINEQTLVTVYNAPNIPQISELNGTLTSSIIGDRYVWLDTNLDSIPNSDSSSFIPSVIGTYYVKVYNQFCNEISDAFNFYVSDINNLKNDYSVKISDYTIHINDNKIDNVKLINMNGQIIIDEKINRIDISNFSKGIYLLHISKNTSHSNFKIKI